MQKTCNANETSTMQSGKIEQNNKPWLDHTSNRYRIVTTMLIHIWNEHPEMQANKLKHEVSFTCPTLNQCIQQVCIQEQDPTRAQE